MTTKLCFLGGTCGNNQWRNKVITKLINLGISSDCLFNPVVEHWNEVAQLREENAKKNATHMFFYLGDPMIGANDISFYSAVEATMSLYDKPEKTVVVFDSTNMNKHTTKAMNQAYKVLKTRFPEANIFSNLDFATDWLASSLIDPMPTSLPRPNQ